MSENTIGRRADHLRVGDRLRRIGKIGNVVALDGQVHVWVQSAKPTPAREADIVFEPEDVCPVSV